MPEGRLSRPLRRLVRTALATLLVATGAVRAQDAPDRQLNAEISLGHEQQSAPLIQVTPDGTQLFVAGLNRLAGHYRQVSLGGMRDWTMGDGLRLGFSGHLQAKRSPTAPDLDFGVASAQLAARWPAAGGSLAVGPGVQRITVAGAPFRHVASLHGDWTWGDGRDGHTVLMADLSRNRHAPDFVDFDSRTLFVSGHRRIAADLPGLDGLDLEFGGWRERNAQAYADLSSRGAYGRISADLALGPLTGSAGYAVHRVRFDEAPLDLLPARRDRIVTVDLAVQWAWAPGQAVRLELTRARNHANADLYNNRYRQAGVTLSLAW